MSERFDVVVLGAGGAGLMCGSVCSSRGRRTLVLDHSDRLGRKILISGGGRCNFTNKGASPKNYYSQNEHFAKSAMARFLPSNFVSLVEKHRVPFYEKKLGQLFTVDTAQRIVDLLRAECEEHGAEIRLRTHIESVDALIEDPSGARFEISTDKGKILAESVVVATGGLSIPKIGATDFGYKLARKFGLEVTPLAPALVSLTMSSDFISRFGFLSGISVDTEVACEGQKFRENILFTHTGLSGPAILQVSLYWKPGDSIFINLQPEKSMIDFLLGKKKEGSRREVKNVLAECFTDRLAEAFAEEFQAPEGPIVQVADASLKALAEKLHRWELRPIGTGGYGKAEVTRGGVSTNELSSKTLETKKIPGLYFIGEVVDVTGWLGGYNFQWAWASGVAAGEFA